MKKGYLQEASGCLYPAPCVSQHACHCTLNMHWLEPDHSRSTSRLIFICVRYRHSYLLFLGIYYVFSPDFSLIIFYCHHRSHGRKRHMSLGMEGCFRFQFDPPASSGLYPGQVGGLSSYLCHNRRADVKLNISLIFKADAALPMGLILRNKKKKKNIQSSQILPFRVL